ncbi:GAF domain-containing protein [Burkholderia arboris]|uniref:GAF domain-containing protein n=1 Tax=Burkholderia arboris TaxID=488730 RepID=UPI00292A46FD|nr:GAF domain-containing protein [Burkholderia arboris]
MESNTKTLDDSRVLDHLQRMSTALGNADQPAAAFAALDRCLAGTVGHKLFTVLMLDLDANLCQRYYSSLPDAYPVGGTKPIVRSDAFFHQIVTDGQPRLCRDYDDVQRAFFDHALIRSLGCESAINYPVRWAGRTIGSLNLLHERAWYDADDFATIALFASLAVAPMLKVIGRV